MERLTLEDKQKTSLDILVEFDEFCKKNNIKYMLAYGTLLGAVRHRGFIPWDDDIDVFIMRNDYERLCAEWIDSSYRLVNAYKSKRYYLTYAKIENTNIAELKEDGTVSSNALGIDIFPLDYLPNNKEKAYKFYSSYTFKLNSTLKKLWAYSVEKNVSFPKRLIGDIVKKIGLLNALARHFDKEAQKYLNKKTVHYGCLVDFYPNGFEYFDSSMLICEDMQFEGYMFPCPVEYHKMLSMEYGEYMKLPPVEKQCTTHQTVFVWKK